MIGRTVLFGTLCALAACAPPRELPTSITEGSEADTLRLRAFGPEFDEIQHIAADPRGWLYVTDGGRDVVEILSGDIVTTTIGGPGSGDHAFLRPAATDPTNGLSIYVADSGNGRIQRFSNEGRLVETLLIPPNPDVALSRRESTDERGRPTAVAAAPSGEIFVIEDRTGRVLRFDDRRSIDRVIGGPSDGHGSLQRPVGLNLLRDDRLAVADAGLKAVLIYDAYGSFERRIADGIAIDVRDVASNDRHLAVFLPKHVLLYELGGMLERVIALELSGEVVSGTFVDSEIVVATAGRLWGR